MALRALPLLFLLFAAPSAFADSVEDKHVAQEAYRDGTRLYDLADFKGALDSFKKAYFHYEDPAFLFNIAQCYRQLGNNAEAVRFYKTYLRKLPDSSNADDVRRLIATLEVNHPEPPPAAPHSDVAPAPPNQHSASPSGALIQSATVTAPKPARRAPAYKKWWVWTVVAVVAAGAATGVALGVTQGHSEQQLPPVHVP